MIDHRERIGRIGEGLVDEFFEAATPTDNWYDSKKDGMINRMTYEVKTLRLNYKHQGFWMPENQWKKLDSVDLLFFVKIPEFIAEGATLYFCANHRTSWRELKHNDKNLRCYPLENCLPLMTARDDRVAELLESSKSISTYGRIGNESVARS